MRKMRLIYGVIMILCFTVCQFYLINTVISMDNYEYLATYKRPICENDLHEFKSDTCNECGSLITEDGILTKTVVKDIQKVEFKNYWGTYKEYESDRFFITLCSFSFILSFAVEFLFVKIYLKLNKKTKKLRRVTSDEFQI